MAHSMQMALRRPRGVTRQSSHIGSEHRAQRLRVSTPRWRTHTASGSVPGGGAAAGFARAGRARSRLVSKRPSHGAVAVSASRLRRARFDFQGPSVRADTPGSDGRRAGAAGAGGGGCRATGAAAGVGGGTGGRGRADFLGAAAQPWVPSRPPAFPRPLLPRAVLRRPLLRRPLLPRRLRRRPRLPRWPRCRRASASGP